MARRSDLTRRAADGTTSPLPSLDGLSRDDEIYLRMMLGLAETGSMFQGRYVEAHVASVIGAHLPTTGTSPWDLFLPGLPDLRIEVKATAYGGRFTDAALEKVADVWIFVTYEHSERSRRPHSFRYAFGARRAVEAVFRGRGSVEAQKVLSSLGELSNDRALRSAIESLQRTNSTAARR